MKLHVIKTQTGLKPAYNSDYEVYSKIPLNEVFEIEYKKPRNIGFHRKYFALIKLAFENQTDYRNLNDLRRDISIVAGYYDEVVNKVTGEVYKMPKSISFSQMDEIEFSELYERTKDVICKWLGVNDESIEEEIHQYF
jgi:hypothetical protein